MINEHNSHIHIPRFHVARQALEEADTAFSRENLAQLDREFPRPDVREPSVQFLRTLGCPEKYIPLVKQLNTPWEIQAYTAIPVLASRRDVGLPNQGNLMPRRV